jgi:hypothetical protein
MGHAAISQARKLGFLIVFQGPLVWKYNTATGAIEVREGSGPWMQPRPLLRRPPFEAIRRVCYCRQLTAISCDYCAGVRSPAVTH